MTPNPFEHIDERMDRIESLLIQMLHANKESSYKDLKRILSIDEVAEYLSLSKSCIYGYVNDRKIPVNKREGKLYFIREEIDNWVGEGKMKSKKEIEMGAKDHILLQKRKKMKR